MLNFSMCRDRNYAFAMEFDDPANPFLNYSLPCNFLIHGWHDGFQGGENRMPTDGSQWIDYRLKPDVWMELLAQEWVRRTNSNVCVIDWSYLAKGDYVYTVKHQIPRVVNDVVTQMEMFYSRGMNISEVSIAGHSLGAHIAGAIGRDLKTFHTLELKAIYGAFANIWNE